MNTSSSLLSHKHSRNPREMNKNTKIVVRALACTAAMTLVSTVGSANAQANKPATAKTAGKPNIVHIVADDLGWKDVGV